MSTRDRPWRRPPLRLPPLDLEAAPMAAPTPKLLTARAFRPMRPRRAGPEMMPPSKMASETVAMTTRPAQIRADFISETENVIQNHEQATSQRALTECVALPWQNQTGLLPYDMPVAFILGIHPCFPLPLLIFFEGKRHAEIPCLRRESSTS